MTRLLISVRDCEEAQIALDEGADLIDIKEPSRGSLGSADVATIRAIARRVAGRVPLSAALGELSERCMLPASLAGQFRYAKFGLAGCAKWPDWRTAWRRAIETLPLGITPVAVAYADATAALAPDAASVLASAQALACGALLLDTHDKSAGSLLDHMALGDLSRLIAKSHRSGLICVIAGSLGVAQIGEVLPLAPDYVAVRGAACTGGRAGRLDRARVRRLVAMVRETDHSKPLAPVA
jgi:hypothetical protein